MIEQENVEGSWWEWEVVDEVPTAVLMIAVGLDLDPTSDGFNSSALDDVLDHANRTCKQLNIGRYKIKIVPAFE